MSKESLKFYCLAEEEYFYDLNQKLIEKIHKEEEVRKEKDSRALHLGHCSACGSQMEAETIEGISVQSCSQCATMALNLHDFERLAMSSQGRRIVHHLYVLLRRRSGPRAA